MKKVNIKKINSKKEAEIVEALKKSVKNVKKESTLEDEVKSNLNDDFVERGITINAEAPVLKRVQRAETLDDVIPAAPAQERGERRNESINYVAANSQYMGEEYRANRQRAEERVVNAQTVRKLRPMQTIASQDLLTNDPRIMEPARPRHITERGGDGRTIPIDDNYKPYESQLPFQKDEKKYKARI